MIRDMWKGGGKKEENERMKERKEGKKAKEERKRREEIKEGRVKQRMDRILTVKVYVNIITNKK